MSAAGPSKARLGRMADVMRGYVERGEAAGVVTLLCRPDEVHVEAAKQTLERLDQHVAKMGAK